MFFVRWRSSVGVVNPKEKKERKESAERWLFVNRLWLTNNHQTLRSKIPSHKRLPLAEEPSGSRL